MKVIKPSLLKLGFKYEGLNEYSYSGIIFTVFRKVLRIYEYGTLKNYSFTYKDIELKLKEFGEITEIDENTTEKIKEFKKWLDDFEKNFAVDNNRLENYKTEIILTLEEAKSFTNHIIAKLPSLLEEKVIESHIKEIATSYKALKNEITKFEKILDKVDGYDTKNKNYHIQFVKPTEISYLITRFNKIFNAIELGQHFYI